MILPVSILNTRNIIYNRGYSFKSAPVAATETKSKSTFKLSPNIPVQQTYRHTPVSTTIQKSKNSYNLFKAKLDSIFYDCTRTYKRRPTNSLGVIEYNGNRFDNGIQGIDRSRVRTGKQAKEFINDNNLISARIILDKGTKLEGNRVLTRIQNAVKNRSIIVREIAIFGENDNTDYASNNRVNAILEESNKLGLACSKSTNRKSNGYHGLAIKVQLEDGFMGTLEIMGKEVAKLKDVEDVLHSLKNGVKVDKKYFALANEYSKLTAEELKALDEYTKAAYIDARSNEIFNKKSDRFLDLPSNSALPECFNINSIAQL